MKKLFACMAISIVMLTAFIGIANGQEIDREQLMDLFYKANAARQANDTETAIASYEKIVELSPSMAEPYLQLGNLYSTKAHDAAAIEKAKQLFKRYLELDPEAEDAEEIRLKMNTLAVIVVIPEPAEPVITEPAAADSATVEPVVTEPIAEQPAEQPEKTLPIEEDEEILQDTLSAEDASIRIDTLLYSRWATSAMAGDKREIWIIDIEEGKRFTFNVGLNENSYIMRTDGRFSEMAKNNVSGKSKADSVFFRFTMDIGTLPAYIDSKELPIVYAYDFRMRLDGNRLIGSLHRKLLEKGERTRILKQESIPCVFHKVPSDYNGFTYEPVSAKDLATREGFAALFNEKVRESDTNALATNDLGCLYAWGIGTLKNNMIAKVQFENAAAQNNLFAKLNLAWMYRKADGIERNFSKAIDLYNQAAESGFADAMVLCGDTYLDSLPDTKAGYEQALACYQKAAFQRCPYAFHRLAGLYKDGLGVEKDLIKAWEYYQKALEMQHPDATTDVGIFYLEGSMVGQDYEKALLLLMKAAAKDHARAMYKLSEMYLEGIGVQPDFMTSKKWLQKAMKAEEMQMEGYSTIKSNINAILRGNN